MGRKTQDTICCGTSKSMSRSCRSPTYAWTWKERDHIIIQGPDEHMYSKEIAKLLPRCEKSPWIYRECVCVCLEGVAKAKTQRKLTRRLPGVHVSNQSSVWIRIDTFTRHQMQQQHTASCHEQIHFAEVMGRRHAWRRKIQDPHEHMLKKRKTVACA